MTIEQAIEVARWKQKPYTATEEASIVLADEVERLRMNIRANRCKWVATESRMRRAEAEIVRLRGELYAERGPAECFGTRQADSSLLEKEELERLVPVLQRIINEHEPGLILSTDMFKGYCSYDH